MKKIVTNIQTKKHANYQEQQELAKAIIKHFNIPDDWKNYLTFDYCIDKITFYKGKWVEWKNRIAEFKCEGGLFVYNEMQRLKIMDAYTKIRDRQVGEKFRTEQNNKVKKIFQHLLAKEFEYDGRKYEINLAVHSNYELLVRMIIGKDDNEFKFNNGWGGKPVLHVKIHFDFENESFTHEVLPLQFSGIGGTIEQIQKTSLLCQKYEDVIIDFWSKNLFSRMYEGRTTTISNEDIYNENFSN